MNSVSESVEDDVFDGVLDGFCYDKDELKRSYKVEAGEYGGINSMQVSIEERLTRLKNQMEGYYNEKPEKRDSSHERGEGADQILGFQSRYGSERGETLNNQMESVSSRTGSSMNNEDGNHESRSMIHGRGGRSQEEKGILDEEGVHDAGGNHDALGALHELGNHAADERKIKDGNPNTNLGLKRGFLSPNRSSTSIAGNRPAIQPGIGEVIGHQITSNGLGIGARTDGVLEDGMQEGKQLQEHQGFKEHELQPSIHIQGANEGCSTAKKSWGDRVEIEEKEASTMTTEFVLETEKTHVYSEIKSSDMGNMAGDIIVT
ncbi:hypothetical protein FRX31_017997, partial [Thalictrum thalictroides]